jgi:hypothetical protein
MQHQVTHVCDDIRLEAGNKLSLMGLYDEAIVVKAVPARLPKLCLYQRWADVPNLQKVTVQIRGTAIGEVKTFDASPNPEHYNPGAVKAQVLIAFAPMDLVRTGEVEFLTFMFDADEPSHVHKIEVRLAG